jgi:hypothetical protein
MAGPPLIPNGAGAALIPTGPVSPPGSQGVPGAPGGNVMALGTRDDAWGVAVPAGTKLVHTTGATAAGSGAAEYYEDATLSPVDANNLNCGFVDTNGRRFRIMREELFMPQQFYEATDANFGFAVKRACEYLSEKVAVNDDTGVYRGTRELFCPAGNYDLGANTVEPLVTMRIRGDSTGYADAGLGTRWRWNHGTTGIRINRLNTIGGDTIRPNGHAADGCIIEGISGYSTTAGTTQGAVEAEAHFIELRARAIIRQCSARYWPGDGLHVMAFLGSTGPFEGNANNTYVEYSSFEYCRNGMAFRGDNSNASTTLGVNCSYNREFGLKEQSFLANTHLGGHFDSNGGLTISGSDGSNMGSLTLATYGGHIYACVPGQEAWCSANPPSGTTAHNQGWYYHADGGVGAFNARAWVAGMTWRPGGAILTDNPNAPHFMTCYSESGQPPSWFSVGLLIGNSFGNTALQNGSPASFPFRNFVGQFVNDGAGLRSLGRMLADRDLVAASGFVGIGGGGGSFFSSPWPNISFDDTSGQNGLVVYPKGGGTIFDFVLLDGAGNQIIRNIHGSRDLDIASATGALRIGGQKVVGPRGARGGATLADVVALLDAWQAWA